MPFDVYKEYDTSPYSLDGTSGEGLSWRNIHGFPLHAVSPLTVAEFENVANPLYRYQLGHAGLYTLFICENEYDAFRSIYADTYNEYYVASPLYESLFGQQWQNSALSIANYQSPLYVSVWSKSKYNRLGAAVDRLAVAIDIWENAINDHVIPGFGIVFNPDVYKGNRAEVCIGGAYIESEDRHQLDTAFGTLPVPAESSSTAIIIKNTSDETLNNVRAQIVNRYALRSSSTPFVLLDQDYNLSFEPTSPFEPVSVLFQNVSGGTCRVKADDVYYNFIEDATSALVDAPDAINYDGESKYIFDSDAPVAGMKFVLNDELSSSDTATLYLSNGAEVFQVSSDDSSWSTSVTLEDSLANDDTTIVYVKAAPSSDMVSSDDYGTEALLQIIGETEEEGPVTVLTNTLDTSSSLSHGAIRLIVPALGYKAVKIRFKFKSIFYRLKITEAWFGVRESGAANFKSGYPINQITFDDEYDFETITNEEKWTDWLDYEINGGDGHILSYHGPLIGCETTTAGTAYIAVQGEDSRERVAYGYTSSNVHYDVVEAQVMTKDYVIASVPLICTVPKNITGTSMKAYLMPSDIVSALDEYGIFLGYTT